MRKIRRREFIECMGVSIAGYKAVFGSTPTKRFPIAFSTLGCPKWEWKTIVENASKWGYAAIELRGLKGEIDLTKCAEFNGTRLKESLRELDAAGLSISDLGSSANFHEADATKRAAKMDEAKQFIDLAHKLKAPYVRVFGNNIVKGEPRQASVDRVIAGLREIGTYAKASGVTVLLESHGDFTDSPTLLEIMKGVGMPSVALLWDAHHTVVASKEEPAYTFRQIGQYVRHTHLKDSKPSGTEVRYVLTGTGTVPVGETVRVLASNGYKGYYCFEWEKMWHPEIEEPEIAFPHYAKVMQEYLAKSGVTPR